MIVSEEHMHAAIAVLTDFDGTAEVAFNARVTENAAKEIHARLYLSYPGSIEERKARATVNPEYAEAKAREAEAYREKVRRESELDGARNITEIWRTENANARAAERVR